MVCVLVAVARTSVIWRTGPSGSSGSVLCIASAITCAPTAGDDARTVHTGENQMWVPSTPSLTCAAGRKIVGDETIGPGTMPST